MTEHLLLAQLLALAALIAGTAEYSTVLGRRKANRTIEADRAVAESGLSGLVRVMLVDR